MKICLAGIETQREIVEKVKPKNVLFNFYYVNKFTVEYVKSEHCKFYMCDSGAFTFLSNTKSMDFDSYADKYIDFLVEHDTQYFFELDIDKIVGLEKVEQYRKRIESRTGKQSIPVWHRSRGKQYYLDMVKEYPYVAIGGLAIKDIKKTEYRHLQWFIDTAHENDCMIHGLGFTNFKHLKTLDFDSVDSTTWLSGQRFGSIYTLRNGYPQLKFHKKEGFRINGKKAAEHNMRIVIKYEKALQKLFGRAL